MILSNTEMHCALDQGLFKIDPEPLPRFKGPEKTCPYQTSSVDLTLGSEISYIEPSDRLPMSIDLRKGNFATFFKRHATFRTLIADQPFILRPNHFVLAGTRERVEFPLSSTINLAGRVEGKSSYARCGLLVHFTAPTIHAGFKGNITLELINLGPLDIGLYLHMPICQLIVEQVHGIPTANESQFQNQSRPAGNI